MKPCFEVFCNQLNAPCVGCHFSYFNKWRFASATVYYYSRSSIIKIQNHKCFSGKLTILRSLIGI